MELQIHILLPVHNRRNITDRFIEQLKQQTISNYRVILIDDGSTDGSSESVKRELPEAVILRGNGNLWWAGALQAGYMHLVQGNVSPDDLVLIINNDVLFGPNYLESAMRVLESGPSDALLGSLCKSPTGEIDFGVSINWSSLEIKLAQNIADVHCMSTRGLFMRMETFKKTGGFRPRLLPHYLSDYEYTYRARKLGLKLLTDSTVWLQDDPTTTGIRIEEVSNLRALLTRNFSRRSASNILAWSAFVLLCSPRRYLIRNLFRASAKRVVFDILSLAHAVLRRRLTKRRYLSLVFLLLRLRKRRRVTLQDGRRRIIRYKRSTSAVPHS
jgi:GT2 family glycosyltransferase